MYNFYSTFTIPMRHTIINLDFNYLLELKLIFGIYYNKTPLSNVDKAPRFIVLNLHTN